MESSDQNFSWSLIAFGEGGGGTPSITVVREVESGEREELQRAATFVRTLASSSTYLTALQAIQDVKALFERLSQTEASLRSPVDLEALETAFVRAARLLSQAADRVGAEVADFPISPETGSRVSTALESSPLPGADALDECRRLASGTDRDHDVTLDDGPGGTCLRVADSRTDGIALLHRAALAVQVLHARRLAALEEEARVASVRLRTAVAEVLDGAPALARHQRLSDGSADPRTLQFVDLALDRIAPLQRLIGRAHQALAGVEPNPAHVPISPETVGHFSSPPATRGPTHEQAATSEPASETPPVIEEGFIDLRPLVRRLSSLSDELEEAWSTALDSVLNENGLEQTRAEWSSLFGSLRRSAEADSKRAEAVGLDQTLTPDLLAPEPEAISLDPSPSELWKQAEVAFLYALKNLGSYSHALFEPPIEKTTFVQGGSLETRTLWESGAFARVRLLSGFLARMHEERVEAEASISGEGVASVESDALAMNRLERTRHALDGCDPEAAVIHLNGFFSAYAASLPEGAALPPGAVAAAELLREAAQRLAAAEPLSGATSTLIVLAGLRAVALLLAPQDGPETSPPGDSSG